MGLALGVHQWAATSGGAVILVMEATPSGCSFREPVRRAQFSEHSSASTSGLERRYSVGSFKIDLLARLQDLLRRERGEQVHDPSNGPRPAGLMAGAQARSVVAVKMLIKQDAIAPVRIVLEVSSPAIDGPPAPLVLQEDIGEPAADLFGDLIQVHVPAGAGGTFHRELVAVVGVVLQERSDHQGVDRHPDRAAPIGVAAEHAGVGLSRQVRDAILLPAGLNAVGVIGVITRE